MKNVTRKNQRILRKQKETKKQLRLVTNKYANALRH